MNREEQIKEVAKDAATVVTDISEIGSKYCTIIPEWQKYFEMGAKWADANPSPFNPEVQLGEERLSQMRKLWAEAYDHIVPTMIENYIPSQVARVFFELGFRAADEHPFVRKEV